MEKRKDMHYLNHDDFFPSHKEYPKIEDFVKPEDYLRKPDNFEDTYQKKSTGKLLERLPYIMIAGFAFLTIIISLIHSHI